MTVLCTTMKKSTDPCYGQNSVGKSVLGGSDTWKHCAVGWKRLDNRWERKKWNLENWYKWTNNLRKQHSHNSVVISSGFGRQRYKTTLTPKCLVSLAKSRSNARCTVFRQKQTLSVCFSGAFKVWSTFPRPDPVCQAPNPTVTAADSHPSSRLGQVS